MLWFPSPISRKELMVFGMLAFIGAGAVQGWVFDRLPHVTDETSHWFQAQLFLTGRLHGDVPPCPEAFFQHNVVMTRDGRWFSKYPPGQALWMALGKRAGGVEWVMPLTSGLGIIFFMALALRFFPPLVVRLAGLGWIISPQILLLAGSYMSHSTTLMACLAGGYALLRAWQASDRRWATAWALGSGFAWMAAVMTRPQDAFLAGLWAGLILMVHGRPWGRLLRLLPGLLLGVIPLAVLFVVRNRLLYGHPLLLGYYLPDELLLFPLITDTFGFTASHTPAVALQYLVWSLYRLNFALFGWPVSFVLLPFACWVGRSGWRQAGWLWLGVALPIVLYVFHSYYGFEYEARYYLFSVPPLLLLSAQGLVHLWSGRVTGSRIPLRAVHVMVVIGLGGFMAYAVARYWGGRIMQEYRPAYEQVSPVLQQAVEAAGLAEALILVPSGDIHRDFRYSAGFIHNDPDLTAAVIYARDRETSRACLKQAFPNRVFYRAVYSAENHWTIEPLRGTLLPE